MLTEKRKADRTKMGASIIALANECGASAKLDDDSELFPRRVMIRIEAARGLCVMIDFDGETSQPDVHCIPWCIDTDSDARLDDRFAPFGYSVNPHHFRKSTQFAYGFSELCDMLRRGLELASSGAAFNAEREARMIAENGTAAQRSASFQAWADSIVA